MSRIADDNKLRLRPGAMEFPRAHHRADHVVPPLNDHGGNVANLVHIFEQVIVGLEKRIVHEVMRFDARKWKRLARIAELINQILIRYQLRCASLPGAPGSRSFQTNGFIFAGEPPVICFEHIAALRFRDDAQILLPHVGEDCAGAFLVEPINLFRAAQKDAAQDERADSLRASLRVSQSESASPRTAKNHPLFNAKMLAQPLDVRDQMPGRVFIQGSMRDAISRSPLIEQHDSIGFRVEERAIFCDQSAARTAVKKDGRLTVRVPALLVINVMDFRYLQHPMLVRLYRIVKSFHHFTHIWIKNDCRFPFPRSKSNHQDWYSTARASKRPFHRSAACLRARYCTGVPMPQGLI